MDWTQILSLAKQNGIRIDDFFTCRGYYSIAVYGYGRIGRQLVDALCQSAVDVSYIVDKAEIKADYRVYKPTDDLPDVDAIVVTPLYDFNDIQKMLRGKVSAEIIAIDEISKYLGIGTLNYVSLSNIAELIKKNIDRLPSDIDLVVGIPRSGMIPASLLALYLNKNMCTLNEFISGSEIGKGNRLIKDKAISEVKKVLIVDDSICTGGELERVKKKLEHIQDNYELIYLCVIALKSNINLINYYFAIIPIPRIFQWNYMNHSILRKACVDIDGVLCVDPTTDENDDGDRYIEFCKNAKPLYIPQYEIHSLVTSRLEKYRSETEEWLRKHSVKYKNLFMLDVESADIRRKFGLHERFKAEIYEKLDDCMLFIESEQKQAKRIAELAGKPCICVSTDEYFPGNLIRHGKT